MNAGSADRQSRPVERVGVAVVEHEGCYLVGVRPEGRSLAGMAEFPGGKCRRGESARDCAVRECREETNLRVEPVRLLLTCQHDYPHARVELHFWLCRPVGSDVPRDGSVSRFPPVASPFRWVRLAELTSLPFPPANRAVLTLLLANERVAGH